MAPLGKEALGVTVEAVVGKLKVEQGNARRGGMAAVQPVSPQ